MKELSKGIATVVDVKSVAVPESVIGLLMLRIKYLVVSGDVIAYSPLFKLSADVGRQNAYRTIEACLNFKMNLFCSSIFEHLDDLQGLFGVYAEEYGIE